MANTIKIRRSSTPGAVPTTAQIALGELALNTSDGKLYAKKSVGGVESIVDLSAGGSAVSISASASDVLTATNNSVSAVDAGADKLVFWDESASKLRYATLDSSLTMTGTTISASGGGGGGTTGGITTAKAVAMSLVF